MSESEKGILPICFINMKIIPKLILILAGVAISCKQDKLHVNVSKIQVDITIDRFEKDLFSSDPSAIKDSIPVWQKRYDLFFSTSVIL